MNSSIQAILISVISALAGGIFLDIYAHVKTRTRKALEQKSEHEKSQIRCVLKEELKPLNEETKRTSSLIEDIKNNDLEVLKKANRDSLRYQLYRIYDKSLDYTTADARYSEKELYNSYKNLDGNHECELRHEKFLNLPHEEEYKRNVERRNK